MTGSPFHRLRFIAVAVVIATGLSGMCMSVYGREASAESGTDGHLLRLDFANSLIHNVNRNDVLAAFKLWVEIIGINRGFKLEATTSAYDDIAEVEKHLKEKSVDMVIMTTSEYLQLGESSPLKPVFTAIRSEEKKFDNYILLARKDGGVTDISSLRGKRVAFYKHGAGLGRRWMDVALGELSLPKADEFFGECSEVGKPSTALLPVFFGKMDAGVVNRATYEVMQEMNPQLRTQLQILRESPSFSESVICLHEDFTEIRQEIIDGLRELDQEVRGEQILLVFKMDRLVPFKPEYLDSVREIMARSELLADPVDGTSPVANGHMQGGEMQ